MPRKDAYGGTISAQAQQDLVSEGIENFELPKSLVMKIAKSSVRRLPFFNFNNELYLKISENVKLQKETVLSLVKGSTVFINYLGRLLLFVPGCALLIKLLSCIVRFLLSCLVKSLNSHYSCSLLF